MEFYRQDWLALQALGHDVTYVHSPWQLRGRYDAALVWWWNYLWLWGPWLRHVPVLTVGTYDVDTFAEMPAIKRWLKRAGGRFSDYNLFASRYEAERAPGFGFAPAAVGWSPHAVSQEVLASPPAAGREPWIVNIAGQSQPNCRRKMLTELLAAFARLAPQYPQWRLVLAGPPLDGGARLRRQARDLGVEARVDFPGAISVAEKAQLLRRCGVYCQVSRYEGFGLAIAEAMACGAVVLTSRVGAVPEVVNEYGLYVDEISEAGIGRGLIACMQAPVQEGPLGTAAARWVRQQFHPQRRQRELQEALERIRAGAGSGRAGGAGQ